MNICFITYRENNPYIGGIENVTYLLSKSFIERGHNVICISQTNTQIGNYTPICEELFFPEVTSDNEANLYFLRSIIEKYNINIIINQNSKDRQTVELCKKIKKVFPDKKIITPLHFDLFYEEKAIANNFFIKIKNGNRISAWMKDIRLFLNFHLCKKREITKQLKNELEQISQISDYIVFLSQGAKEDATRLLGKKLRFNSAVIGNPIEINNDNKYDKHNEILYVGRIEFGLKRFDRMLYIWKELEKKNPDWELIVLGDGGYRNLFEKKAKEWGLERIHFKGFKNPTEYYKTASIVCLTSSSEGFAKVLAEAQSYTCVPVAFNSFTAISEIISNKKNGFYIKAFNKGLFVEQLQELMDNNHIVTNIGIEARKNSLQFSIERITDKWEELFNKLNII